MRIMTLEQKVANLARGYNNRTIVELANLVWQHSDQDDGEHRALMAVRAVMCKEPQPFGEAFQDKVFEALSFTPFDTGG